MNNEELLTPEEVAKRLKLNLESVRRLLRQGKMRAYKAGRSWRIPVSAIHEYLRPTSGRPAVMVELGELIATARATGVVLGRKTLAPATVRQLAEADAVIERNNHEGWHADDPDDSGLWSDEREAPAKVSVPA